MYTTEKYGINYKSTGEGFQTSHYSTSFNLEYKGNGELWTWCLLFGIHQQCFQASVAAVEVQHSAPKIWGLWGVFEREAEWTGRSLFPPTFPLLIIQHSSLRNEENLVLQVNGRQYRVIRSDTAWFCTPVLQALDDCIWVFELRTQSNFCIFLHSLVLQQRFCRNFNGRFMLRTVMAWDARCWFRLLLFS